MKYNNTYSSLLSSLACGRNNSSIKSRLDNSRNIDLLYKDDAGIFSAAITRDNHELLKMLLDYMEKSGQMEEEHDRLCDVLGEIYRFNKNCSKETKEILYKYIPYDMDDDSDINEFRVKPKSLASEDFSDNEISDFEEFEDINAKIQEVKYKGMRDKQDKYLSDRSGDHSMSNNSTSGGSGKKETLNEVKVSSFDEVTANDHFEDYPVSNLSGALHNDYSD